MQSPVVITGVGCTLPIGKNLNESLDCLTKNKADRTGSLTAYNNRYEKPVGLIPDHYFESNIEPRERARYDRASMLVVNVVRECIESAGLVDEGDELARTGIISGSAFGCMDSSDAFLKKLYEGGPSMLDPMKFPFSSHNYPISVSAIKYGLKGPITSFVASVGSSFTALHFASCLIARGQAKRIIVIGFDEMGDLLYALLNEMGCFNGDGHTPKTRRKRAVISEGCAGIVVEDSRAADSRSATVWGEIAGWSAAYGSSRSPEASRIKETIKKSMEKANWHEKNLDLLVLNGAGMPGDEDVEKEAVESLQRDGYWLHKQIDLKAILGNYLGASGLVEAVFALQMIKTGNNTLDSSKQKFMESVLEKGKETPKQFVINNFGLGGNIASFLIKTPVKQRTQI